SVHSTSTSKPSQRKHSTHQATPKAETGVANMPSVRFAGSTSPCEGDFSYRTSLCHRLRKRASSTVADLGARCGILSRNAPYPHLVACVATGCHRQGNDNSQARSCGPGCTFYPVMDLTR